MKWDIVKFSERVTISLCAQGGGARAPAAKQKRAAQLHCAFFRMLPGSQKFSTSDMVMICLHPKQADTLSVGEGWGAGRSSEALRAQPATKRLWVGQLL